MTWRNDQVTEKETEKIISVARECLDIEGDFVELGCYKGDTSLVLAEILRKHNNVGVEKPVENLVKKLWIYDSFEGLPEKNKEDESELGRDFRKGALAVTKREVKMRFLRAGLPVPVIKRAWFDDLTEKDLPGKIAFAFLDGDLYESIKQSLLLVENKIGQGSVIVVHDYQNAALPGVAKAVDEWINGRDISFAVYETMAIIGL